MLMHKGPRRFVSTIMVIVALGLAPEALFGDDTTPPELIEFDFTPKVIDTSAGPATIVFTLRLADDLSGVDWGRVWIISPSGGQVQGAAASGYGEPDVVVESTIGLAQDSEAGTWSVYRVVLVDEVGNSRLLETPDLIGLGFPTTIEVTSSPDDTTAPQLVEFDFTPKAIDTGSGPATVQFRLNIGDDLSGVDWGRVWIMSPSGGQVQGAAASGNGELDAFLEFGVDVPQYSEVGSWSVYRVALMDEVGNSRLLETPDLVELGFPTELQVGVNQVPVARATIGEEPPIAVGDTVSLDGSESTDPDGDALTYAWSFDSMPEGSVTTIADPTAANTTFFTDLAGVYVIRLIVNDGVQDSEPDMVTITALAPQDAATEVLADGLAAIDAIPLENLHNENSDEPLKNKVTAAVTMIEEGRYQEALEKLENDILQKTDGCETGDEPDNNDWILSCDDQAALYSLIARAIELVSRLVP